ncbi:MAG: methyl-accepting chemotaxis protein [Microcystaceae cyanobacterium]
MASEKDYSKLYGQAYAAYGQGNYEEAARHIEEMESVYPDDPNVLLLDGHIQIGLTRYPIAQEKYQAVLQLTDRPDLRDCAEQALAQIQQLSESGHPSASPAGSGTHPGAGDDDDFTDEFNFSEWQAAEQENWAGEDFDGLDWDSAVFNADEAGEPTLGKSPSEPFANPFATTGVSTGTSRPGSSDPFEANPFAINEVEGFVDWEGGDFLPTDDDNDEEKTLLPGMGESTFVVPSDIAAQQQFQHTKENTSSGPTYQPWQGETENERLDPIFDNELVPTVQSSPSSGSSVLSDLDAFSTANLDGLGDFDLTDIAPELPDSTLFTQGSMPLSPSTAGIDISLGDDLGGDTSVASSPPPGMVTWLKPDDSLAGEMSGASSRFVKPTVEVDPGWLGWFVNAPLKRKQLYVAIASGLTSALTVLVLNGITSVKSSPAPSSPKTTVKASPTPPKGGKDTPAPAKKAPEKAAKPSTGSSNIGLVALGTGLAAAGITWLMSHLLIRQVRRTIDELQNQFDAIYEGNFNVRARVYSEDELGQLAQRFNYISQVILTATSEAQERAAATEKAREKLQRQVIRLLDDVEGASRGDLTVQAEVTADELGAVADAFNLTIQNLREIVLQVKKAAKQVNRNCTDSEAFARNNSSDALRMAEELAVTLNSVQLMTESIQRVAENAREAEEVAHTSSLTALKGGESVERMVSGILQIRETVSETARKVKRLAEASQEISKIVAVISQIASRTNLLALNASIQAAKAGEAGRGFAIVADEVRQLADRSAKSLKEIEQIVLQIQSETGSVMTAMEEGIQQVIDVTDKSEQSKRSLEDIIEVSNRINTLVRSITADTVKQKDNSGAVAQVMQSIELTAQETSQESQRVAGSLQTLVSISQDLLNSVERFRLEKGLKS